jgi:hypothetical protein
MQSRALREASIDASKVKVHFVGNVTSSLHLAHNEVARSPLPILASYDKDTPSVSGGTSVEVAATQPGYKPGGS